MTYFDQTLECGPREQIESRQGRLFLSLMEKLKNKNLFYTEKLNRAGLSFGDIQSLEDLQKVPFTSKSELMEAQEQSPPFGTNLTFPEYFCRRPNKWLPSRQGKPGGSRYGFKDEYIFCCQKMYGTHLLTLLQKPIMHNKLSQELNN